MDECRGVSSNVVIHLANMIYAYDMQALCVYSLCIRVLRVRRFSDTSMSLEYALGVAGENITDEYLYMRQ